MEEIKMSQFVNNIILYSENFKEFTKSNGIDKCIWKGHGIQVQYKNQLYFYKLTINNLYHKVVAEIKCLA